MIRLIVLCITGISLSIGYVSETHSNGMPKVIKEYNSGPKLYLSKETGYYPDGTKEYENKYYKGRLKSSSRWDESGQKIDYAKLEFIGSWLSEAEDQLIKFNKNGTSYEAVIMSSFGPRFKEMFGSSGMFSNSTWTISNDNKTITTVTNFDKDLTNRIFSTGALAQEIGLSADGSTTYITEILSVTNNRLCITGYLESTPVETDTTCYVKINDSEFKRMTRDYISANTFFNRLIDLIEDVNDNYNKE